MRKFGGKRARSHARDICLRNSNDAAHRGWGNACYHKRAKSRGRRRGHVRIGAVIRIKKSALGTLKKNTLVGRKGLLNDMRSIGDVGKNVFPCPKKLRAHRIKRREFHLKTSTEPLCL